MFLGGYGSHLYQSAYKKGQETWVLDDESYFMLDLSSIVNNDVFYTSNIKDTPASVKFKQQSKYPEKVMVWLAASTKGISEIFITPSGMAVNSETYINDCLRPRLIPVINKHHSTSSYVFWPDLASSHYSKKTLAFLDDQNVTFVPKNLSIKSGSIQGRLES